MNRKFAFAALIAIFAAAPAFASEEVAVQPNEGKAQKTVVSATTPETSATDPMSIVKKALDDSKAALEAKDLKSIHPHTSKGMDALKKLLTTETSTPEKKERLEASIKQMINRLDALHDAADANDAPKTASELKKAEGALKLLELQVR